MANFLTMYNSESDAQQGINGLKMPTPSYSSAKQTASTLVNSGRSALNGKMYGQRVGDRDLVKLELKWAYLTATQWSEILSKIATSDDNGFYVWLKYFDMTANAWKLRQFYPSDRTATPFRINHETKEILSWLDCSFNFVDTGAEEIEIV